MDEVEEALGWVRTMSERYRWGGDSAVLVAEAEVLGTDGRESVQYLFEWLYFDGLLNYRFPGRPPGVTTLE